MADDATAPDVAQNAESGNPLKELSKFQKFAPVRINRSALKNAEYNPRTITEKNKRKLKKVLEKNGLVESLVWNRRTGNLVGGHQRISILDGLEGSKDYSLDVSVIDVSLKQEMEINIALNNDLAQGMFDISAVAELFKEYDLEPEPAGYDDADMLAFFGENPLEAPGIDFDELAEKLAELRESHDAVKETLTDAQDPNFFSVLVFKNHTMRARFAAALKLEDVRHLDGATIAEMMGIDLDKPAPGENGEDADDDEFDPEALTDDADEQESEEG